MTQTDRIRLEASWRSRLLPEFEQAYMQQLRQVLHDQLTRRKVIYPRGPEYYKELKTNLGVEPPDHGCLESWARHLVIASPHPSPLSASRGFFGSRPFSRIDRYLCETGQTPIDWRIPPARECGEEGGYRGSGPGPDADRGSL